MPNENEEFEFRYRLEKEKASTATAPAQEAPVKKDMKSIFRDSVKQTLYGMAKGAVGQGISEMVPGMESPIVQAGNKSAGKLGQTITDSMGVPSTPNLPVKFPGLEANINPNSVTSTLIGGALTPASLATIGTAGPGMAMERSAIQAARPGALMKSARNVMKEAETLTKRILQPTVTDLADAIAKGERLPSIKRGAENISTARTFDEVVGHLKTATKELFDERNLILSQNDVSIGSQALNELDELVKSASKSKVMSTGKIKNMDNVFYREAQYIDEHPNMTVTEAQARKEELQKLTRPLLEKRQAKTETGAESAELQAYDALRAGYRKAILKALPKDKAHVVDKINSKYEGLLDATELASKQAAKSQLEVPKTLIEKVASSFGLSPSYTAFRLVAKEFAGLTGKTRLGRTTEKIMELRTKSDTLRQLAKLARKVS